MSYPGTKHHQTAFPSAEVNRPAPRETDSQAPPSYHAGTAALRNPSGKKRLPAIGGYGAAVRVGLLGLSPAGIGWGCMHTSSRPALSRV